MRLCQADDCQAEQYAKGFCLQHYRQDYYVRHSERIKQRSRERYRALTPEVGKRRRQQQREGCHRRKFANLLRRLSGRQTEVEEREITLVSIFAMCVAESQYVKLSSKTKCCRSTYMA